MALRSIWKIALCLWAFGASAGERKVVENFEGKFEWSKGNERNGKSDYFLFQEGANHFLRAHFIPGTDGKVIRREVTWNTDRMPYLSWRWRVNKFPTGSKILIDGKRDAAAQVFVAWRVRNRAWMMKYYWSETDPIGTDLKEGKWNPAGQYYGVVIRVGGKTGEWQTEKRNIRADFIKAWGRDPSEEANGLAVLTDGDGTNIDAQADYDDFVASAD